MTKAVIKIDFDTSEFKKYVKDCNQAYAKVGVLGDAGGKDMQTISAYAIGQEYGVISKNLPKRSFIKEPLQAHLGEEIKEVTKTIKEQLDKGNIKKAVAILGLKGVEIVKKAFETQNDGKWAPFAESTLESMQRKDPQRAKDPKLLRDTGALYSSISSEVVVK